MIGIIGIAAALTVLSLSLVITRLATVALTFTGLSMEAAKFQARSAFTGTGFTTREAEKVVDHPVRRRIIMTLMLLRSAGIITILLSLILSFIGSDDTNRLFRLAWLVGGAIVIWLLSMNTVVDRFLQRLMNRAVKRWTDLDVRDYIGLLKLSGDYVIRELRVEEGDWLASKELNECHLRDEGVSVIGIYRDNGNYVGAPKGRSKVRAGDTLVLYGRAEGLKKLDQRRSGTEGDRDHDEAKSDERRRMVRQDREEAELDREHAE